MDQAPSNITKNVLSYLENNKSVYSLIPGKLTRFLQPLDIGTNFPFKQILKNRYLINKANKLTNKQEVILLNLMIIWVLVI